jgi:membrane-associated phospholipid phosphatase
MGMIIFRFNFAYDQFVVKSDLFGTYLVSINLILIILVVICGLIGTSRLFIGAHDREQVYGGYVVGFASQIIAFMILH